jgi:hypothetical protein
MDCKKFEKLILRAFDGRIIDSEKKELDAHVQDCTLCSATQEEYRIILDTLKEKDFPEPKPYFWERLQSKLKEKKEPEPLTVWRQWGIRAIPVSLILVILFGTAIILFSPQEGMELSQSELSQSEALLLRNLDPLEESRAELEQEDFAVKSMELIFTADENNNSSNNGTRRYQP